MEYNYDELYHHGVKGMKWGVRRFRNVDGSLTPAGKKRYDTESGKAKRDLSNSMGRLQIKAYNKAADAMNRGGIDKFNEDQRKKYGEQYSERKGYDSDYAKTFNKMYSQQLQTGVDAFLKKNKHAKKAEAIIGSSMKISINDLM